MKKLVLTVSALALAICSAHAAGFGIYEASSRGNAVGGTLVGDAGDATANYYNPANIAFATNYQVAAGVTFINPYCDVEVNHVPQGRMEPGWFTIPAFFLTVPLPFDFAFGWGNYTEYGLGSHYRQHWDLAADTQYTTMRQVTLNPNLAYKVCDWMSVSAGIRESWIQFENAKQPYWGASHPLLGNYDLYSHLKGEDWAMGYNVGFDFKPTEKLSVGLVYRSQIKHKIRGDFDMTGNVGPYPVDALMPTHSHASAMLKLPRSLTGGINYKVTEKFRVGTSVTWTQWKSVNTINFEIPEARSYALPLRWKDAWRVGFGLEYDWLTWLTLRCGYTFDEDPSRKTHSTTMLPCGDRHIIGAGLGFKLTDNLFLDLGYSFIRMNNEHYWITYDDTPASTDKKRYSVRNGCSHLVSASVRYSF